MSKLRSSGRWTLARQLRAALALLAVLLVVAASVLLVVLWQADRALTAQTRRTLPARLAASDLLTSLVDQETGLRGYALTGDEAFLAPYRDGLVAEQRARAALDRYVRPGDPARLPLASVDAAITAWRDQYASLRIGGPIDEDADADATVEFGRQLFERVRESSAALDAQLAREARDGRAQLDRDRHLILAVLAVMAGSVIAAMIGLERSLQRLVVRPMDRLAAQVAVVSKGEHAEPIEPDGPPELRSMGAGVESMRVELVQTLAEVEEQRRSIERRVAELARSNADLEQFAYVASHDLQEPLRKVASFCQLLEQRYGGQLDERADQYIALAVDGAKRMQVLINDLLTLSRVGRTSDGFVAVQLSTAVDQAWRELSAKAAASGASLDLPPEVGDRWVQADPALLGVLFVNLLGNSIKYRRADAPPEIQISSMAEGDRLRIEVADNGIGIPEQYAGKVFVIFQRLHGRDEYEGTGIGLALAKKIVEFHGGTIELRTSPIGGACVSFTLSSSESPDHD